MHIIGPRTVDLSLMVAGLYTYDFTAVDFNTATGYATLEGPLSLSVRISNQSDYGIYIGMNFETLNQNVTVSDRKHIAFVAGKTTATISPASVPQLAILEGMIKKVSILFYAVNDPNTGGATGPVSVSLIIDNPAVISAPQEMIGNDELAHNPGALFVRRAITNIGAGVANGIVDTICTGTYGRMHLKSIQVRLPVTAAVSQLFTKVHFFNPWGGNFIGYEFDSSTTTVNNMIVYPDLIVPKNWCVQYQANNATAGAVNVEIMWTAMYLG